MELTIASLSIAALVALYIARWVQVSITHRLKANALSCAPPVFSPDACLLGLRRLADMLLASVHGHLPLYAQTLLSRFPGHYTIPISDLGRPGIFTADPINIAAVHLGPQQWGLGQVRHALMRFFGYGIFTQDGEAWVQSKKLLKPSFRASAVEDVGVKGGLLEEHVHKLFERMDAEGDKEGGVDMNAAFHRLMLDFATEFLFGQSSAETAGEVGHHFDAGTKHTIISWMFGTLHPLWYPPVFRRAVKFVHAYTDTLVARILSNKTKSKRYVFLTAVAEITQDPVVLRSQSLNILLAGRDTTAATLSWIIYELVCNPDMFARLRAEVKSIGSDGPLMKAVVSETLRVYTPTPYVNRTSSEDVVLPRGGGPDEMQPVFVPKGTIILYSLISLHRRPDIWGPDAAEWKPDRWLRDEKPWKVLASDGGATAAYYIPFGMGPRLCPGQQLAQATMSYTLASLCRQYRTAEIGSDWMQEPLWESSITGPPLGKMRVKWRK